MGWWWSPSSGASNPSPEPAVRRVDEELIPIPDNATAVKPPTQSASKRALTRDEESDEELITWLKNIQAESEQKPAAEDAIPNIISPTRQPPPENISPDSLYPTELSCRSAFDYALFCQSFGGQFVNVYRYGGFRSCSNHWEDFWLCMRTRNWDENDRKRAIRDHYKKKAIKWKTGPSSEDVWDVRIDPVKDAFQGDLEELERRIAEWKKDHPDAKDPYGSIV